MLLHQYQPSQGLDSWILALPQATLTTVILSWAGDKRPEELIATLGLAFVCDAWPDSPSTRAEIQGTFTEVSGVTPM